MQGQVEDRNKGLTPPPPKKTRYSFYLAIHLCNLCRTLHGKAPFDLEVLASLVLHVEAIPWGHVHLHAIWNTELQLLEQGGQEEEDLAPGNVLPQAAPLPHTEQQDFLALFSVYFLPTGRQEPLWIESRRVLPKLPAKEAHI